MTFARGNEEKTSSFSSHSTECSYIASCDVGTTTIRCYIYKTSPEFSTCGSAIEKVTLLSPEPGYVEIEPTLLWDKFVSVIKNAIQDSSLHSSQIRCLGISTQRASFVLWDRCSGEPLTNFITWKDMRANDLVDSLNTSLKVKLTRLGSGLLHFITRVKRFQAASHFKFQNVQVSARLKWMLDNIPKVRNSHKSGNLMFGTIDTWLTYKLTGGKVFATDHSNASGTGFYDPFLLEWSKMLVTLIGLPSKIFPRIRDTVDFWGETDHKIFGATIPITAVVSDQGAALYGECGFNVGDIKVTLGTGAFLDLNTGRKPHTSLKGIYPLIGWKDPRGAVHMTEGASHDNGTIIDWGQKMGFYSDPNETSDLAFSVLDTKGVYFIPGFQGIQAPINDSLATGGFIGLTTSAQREHLVRAMLESLAFRVYLIYQAMVSETNCEAISISQRHSSLRVDGGVSQNDFIVQTIATLTNRIIERSDNVEASALGCCFLAGVGIGIWSDYTELTKLRGEVKIFDPDLNERPKILHRFKCWKKALQRFFKWKRTSNSFTENDSVL